LSIIASADKASFDVRREIRRHFDSREEAERFDRLAAERVRRLLADYDRGVTPCITIRGALDLFVKNRVAEKGIMPATRKNLERVLLRLALDLSRGAGDVSIDRDTTVDLDEWACKRLRDAGYKKQAVSRGTVKKELGMLANLARVMVRKNLAPPDLDIFRYRFEARKARRVENDPIPTPHEFVRIANRIGERSPQVALVLYGMLYFGARPQALFRTDWSRIQMPNSGRVEKDGSTPECQPGLATLPVLKKGDPAQVPVPYGSGRHWVLRLARELHKKYHGRYPSARTAVFCTRQGRAKRAPSGAPRTRRGWMPNVFANELRRHANALSLPDYFVAYVTRHASVTWLLESGVRSMSVLRYMKDRNASMLDIYNHVADTEAADAYAAVEKATLAGFDEFVKGAMSG
jgi:integrase